MTLHCEAAQRTSLMESDPESDPESDAECLSENLAFDDAINTVSDENGTPESRADDRRFLRMARLLQRVNEIDKEWIKTFCDFDLILTSKSQNA